MFVHNIPEPPTKTDLGIYILTGMEAEGYFDPLSPEWLQDILSKLGRKDLAADIKEYKQSAAYKKAVRGESERERESRKGSRKKAKEGKRWGASEVKERGRWREMFAKALTHTAQMVEQAELLRKAIKDQESDWRIEQALQSILTAQGEVESLSRTLQEAIAAAGTRISQEETAESEGTEKSVSPVPYCTDV